jgi:hypothetical protein
MAYMKPTITALNVLMQQRIEAITELEEAVLLNAKEFIVPFFSARQRKITKTYDCELSALRASY